MNSESSLYKVVPKPFQKSIEIPSSKSHANRALIIAAIRGNGFKVENLSDSTDVVAMISCLKKVGLQIEVKEKTVVFHNYFPACEEESQGEVIDLHTGDGGTTNRFLLALLSRGKKTYRIIPTEKMSERPIDDLLLPLMQLNVQIEKNKNGAWIEMKGPATMVKTSKITIDCKESTQFASAMMMAFSNLPLSIEYTNVVASRSYLSMTEYLLKQTTNKNSYFVPVDFSSASYPLALALISGEVNISNCLELDIYQADSAFVGLMKKAGGDIAFTPHGLSAKASALKPFDVDGSEFPDLVPTLAFMASHIPGESVLRNLAILKHKESDRLEEVINLLRIFNIPFTFDSVKVELRIKSGAKAGPMTVKTARDHRMVMLGYLLLRTHSGGELAYTDCIDKSFPHFLDIMD